jgi:hypothetical protein
VSSFLLPFCNQDVKLTPATQQCLSLAFHSISFIVRVVVPMSLPAAASGLQCMRPWVLSPAPQKRKQQQQNDKDKLCCSIPSLCSEALSDWTSYSSYISLNQSQVPERIEYADWCKLLKPHGFPKVIQVSVSKRERK